MSDKGNVAQTLRCNNMDNSAPERGSKSKDDLT